MALAVASAWCGLHHAPTFTAKRAALFGRSLSDLLVVTDFDLTLTCGTSLQCHDVLGTGRCMPAGARADFAELLDFSRPFPAHLEREAWWTRANEILLSHNAPLRHQLPHLVAEAGMALRPGALELLAKLAQLDVPVRAAPGWGGRAYTRLHGSFLAGCRPRPVTAHPSRPAPA